LLALRWPVEIYGFTVLPLLIIYAMLLIMSLIDLDHLYLPDSLTLPAIFIAIGAAAYYQPLAGLPSLAEAAVGSAVAAGIIALINRLGSLIVRRMADTKERLWPIGMDQVNIAFVFGALGGWVWGLGFALLSVIVNLIARKPIRLEEKYMYLLWFVAIALSATKLIVSPVESLAGTFIAAGIVAIVGSFYWWFHEIFTGVAEDEDFDEPVAMGFGDVKLAAILGAILGWQSMLVALFLAFIIGAVVGVVVKIMGGSRIIPFGPPLVLGALIALFYGQQIISWYLGMLT
ncbi:MAG TPA: prepilin peptidase, partial [Trueperaceae bacterium]|nr:prepilin peptidase [Trueperaceae bacterium]